MTLADRSLTTDIAGSQPVRAQALQTDAADEARLVERLRAGDEAAYEEMVRVYGGRLLAVARRLLRHEEDAQDALQDGFVSAFKALRTFRGDCRLSTWLHRIVVNAALMKIRGRQRHPETSIESLLPVFLEDGHHAATFRSWGSVEQSLVDRETRAEVRAAIRRRPGLGDRAALQRLHHAVVADLRSAGEDFPVADPEIQQGKGRMRCACRGIGRGRRARRSGSQREAQQAPAADLHDVER